MPNTDTLFDNFAQTPKKSCEPDKNGGPDVSDVCSAQYSDNGALTLQRTYHDFLLGGIVGRSGVGVAQFPSKEYRDSDFWSSVIDYIALFYLIGFSVIVLRLVKLTVRDKEAGVTGLLLISGVPLWAASWSFWVASFLVHVWAAIPTALVSTRVFEDTSNGAIILLFVLLLTR